MGRGFSMMSLIITVAIVVILGVLVFAWIDPAAKITSAKNAARRNDVFNLHLALSKYADEHSGTLPVSAAVTTNKKVLCSSATTLSCSGDSQTCLTITDSSFLKNYLGALPVDPDLSSTANTGYYLALDSNNNFQVGSCQNTAIFVSGGRISN